jgi:hypothetical protein
MNTTFRWAFYDEEGNVIRFVSSEKEGALPYPPQAPSLPKDHPDWDDPLF